MFIEGQRVKFTKYMGQPEGTGTVVCVGIITPESIGIKIDSEFVAPFRNHTLGGRLDSNSGWWFDIGCVFPLDIPYSPTQTGDTDDDI